MKHVVSVSLGSSRRDADLRIELLGREVRLERRGVDGDLAAAGRLIAELDGRVDAIGLGGLDRWIVLGDRRYEIRDAARLARAATRTPVVCGAGLKHGLERAAVRRLDARVGWRGRRVLVVSGADRYGMAEELEAHGAAVRYGDLATMLGVPVALRSAAQLRALARALLPLVAKLPIRWLYPVGAEQAVDTADERPPRGAATGLYRGVDTVAGDWHLIRRTAPPRLDGAVVLTNTTTAADVAWAAARGVALLVTTTPRVDGRSLPTNLLEAALVAAAGPDALEPAGLAAAVEAAGLEGDAIEPARAAGAGAPDGGVRPVAVR